MDTPEQIRAGASKHGAKIPILSDPDLAVTDLYGLWQPKGMGPNGIGGLPIPTTLLADSDNVVRWIDRSEHYSTRSDPDRVFAAVRSGLGLANG